MIALGSRIGPYEIVARLGAGGMGEVYRARDTRLGRDVAVKILQDATQADAGSIARFRQEACLAGALNHPNVLAVYDVGEWNGSPYLVTELLEGESLRERLSTGSMPGSGPSSGAKVVAIALQIAQGLSAAHDKGIVHRDLKPENIFLTRDGRVKILDFGIAKLLVLHEATLTNSIAPSRTATGALFGTPAYMSPEHVRGEPVDARSDLFALGCVLYEMLSGRRPFSGKTPIEIGAAILHDEPLPLPPEVPQRLARLVGHCLEKSAENRFQTARDLIFDLEELSGGGVAKPAQVSGGLTLEPPKEGASPSSSKQGGDRFERLLFGIGVLAAVSGLLWYLVGRPPHRISENGPLAATAASIAVLPFADMSAQKDQEYFSDGLAEEILDALAQVDGLRVAGRTSSFSFKGKNDDLRTIGDKLNVSTVLEGSVRKEGSRVRIVAQLINARDGFHLWSQTYDRELTGVFAAQEEISRAVVDALRVRLVSLKDPPPHHVPGPDAHNEYLLGNQFLRHWTSGFRERAAAAYERATSLDSEYAQAWAGLARATLELADVAGTTTAAFDGFDRATTYAEKAIALDPLLADGYAARAMIRAIARWDWKSAEADFSRALDLNPGDASTRLDYSQYVLDPENRLGEAVEEALRAARIDPLAEEIWNALGRFHIEANQFDAARTALERSVHIAPEQVGALWSYLCGILLLEKRPAEALVQAERAKSSITETRVCKAAALHDLGRTEEARRVLDAMIARESGYAAFQIAETLASFGQPDEAFAWLDRAYAQRDGGLVTMRGSVLLRPLRSDPRYTALLKKMNLPTD